MRITVGFGGPARHRPEPQAAICRARAPGVPSGTVTGTVSLLRPGRCDGAPAVVVIIISFSNAIFAT